MREWIFEQGILFYFFCSAGLLGMIATAAANRAYKRLIKEADNMEKSEHRLIKYIKLKYSSYYTIGLKANDEKAMIKRYLYRYKIGPASLMAWSKAGLAALAAVILICLGAVLYGVYRGTPLNDMLSMSVLAAFIATALGMQYKISAFGDKQAVFCAQMEDNLENFLKNKIEYGHVLQEQKASSQPEDGEKERFHAGVSDKAFFGVSDDEAKQRSRGDLDGQQKKQREEAKGQAAAAAASMYAKGRNKSENNSVYSKAASQLADSFDSEEIDAKVVEDILKEFLN